MKTIIATVAASFFAASLSAADIYKHIGAGNADLSPHGATVGEQVAVQPSIGDGVDRFHGFGDGNPDVVQTDNKGYIGNKTPDGDAPVAYVGPGATF